VQPIFRRSPGAIYKAAFPRGEGEREIYRLHFADSALRCLHSGQEAPFFGARSFSPAESFECRNHVSASHVETVLLLLLLRVR
jgi:hypothetical protein